MKRSLIGKLSETEDEIEALERELLLYDFCPQNQSLLGGHKESENLRKLPWLNVASHVKSIMMGDGGAKIGDENNQNVDDGQYLAYLAHNFEWARALDMLGESGEVVSPPFFSARFRVEEDQELLLDISTGIDTTTTSSSIRRVIHTPATTISDGEDRSPL